MQSAETIALDEGIKVEIYYDEEPSSPREWSNLSIIAAHHRRSDLGDEGFNYRDFPDIGSDDELRDYLVAQGAKHLIPLYLYEHSGMTITASKDGSPYSCPWDSGQVGFVFTTDEKIAEIGTPEDSIDEVLIAEVKDYDSFLRGEVYGYVIEDAEGENLDSCWGFVGDIEDCTQEALLSGQHYVAKAREEEAEREYWLAREVVTIS